MKKGLKITIIVFCIVTAVFVIDSAQALIFDNSPIIKVRKYYDGGTLRYKDGGLFVNTYCGVNGAKDTVIKGFSHSLTFDEQIEIVDKPNSSTVDVYCGNTQTTIHFDKSNKYTFMGGNSVTLTDLLRNLDYEPDRICKCLPEYTVDTEFGTGYGIHLTEGYARYNGGQVDLTKEQVEQITEIINWAKKEANKSEVFEKAELDANNVSSVTIKIFTSLDGGPKQKVITDKALISEMVDAWNNVELKNRVESSKPGTTLSVSFNDEISFSINNGNLGYDGHYYEQPNNLAKQFRKCYDSAKEEATNIKSND